MYQSFVRGNLAKKRKSQFSERKAAREGQYTLNPQAGVKDFNDPIKNALGLAKQ